MSGIGLLGKFAVLSLIPMVLLGLLLASTLKHQIRERTLENATEAAQLVARLGIQPLLSPADLSEGLTPDRFRALDEKLRAALLGEEIARIKIWNRDHRIVFSDDRSQVGQRYAANEELEEALDGEVASELSGLEKEENESDRAYGELLEVYIPLQFAGQSDPAGAFEIYLPYRPIAAQIDRDTKRLYLLLSLGLLVLWALLLPIAYRTGRILRNQALRLKVLLSREQQTVGRLQELDRMKTDFISVASHEMRTPLTTIIGVVKSLKHPDMAENGGLREELLGRMERQGDRLLGLVDQLLHTARLESGKGEPKREVFDFATMAEEAASVIGHGELTIEFDVPPDLPPLVSDRDMVYRMLTNLLGNAVKYSPPGTVCHVGARAGADGFRFWVSDQGMGMTAKQLEHVFEPFWQVDSSMTRTAGGVGLGLYLVKLLTSTLGGDVSVESELGRGTRFDVTLPLEEQSAAKLEAVSR